MSEIAWFGGWVIAIVIVYASALRLLGWCWAAPGRWQRALRLTLVGTFILAMTAFANVALVRHDRQIDLTSAHHYTPNAQALAVIDALNRPVALTYFYRGDDPAGVRAQRIVRPVSSCTTPRCSKPTAAGLSSRALTSARSHSGFSASSA